MLSLKNLKVRNKLWLIIGSALAGIIVLISMSLVFLKGGLIREREHMTRHLVESAHSVIDSYYRMSVDGKMSREEAQSSAIAIIKAMRFDDQDKEYFWINDMQPKVIMHPVKPELDGKDVSALKDPRGKRLFVEFVETVRARKAGFVYYLWPKPGFDDPVQKISYVKGFEPWGWIVGSGIYLDDLSAVFWSSARQYAMAGMAILVPILAMSWIVAKNITRTEENLRMSERQLLKSKAELTVKHEQLSALFSQVESVKREWERTMDCIKDMVILLDREGRVRRCNRATAEFAGIPHEDLRGIDWEHLVQAAGVSPASLVERSGEIYHARLDHWFFFTCYPFEENGDRGESGAVITIHDTTETKRAAMEVGKAYAELKEAQAQMIQGEKMASIGQLAAGVAHEINNPTGYVMSNLGTLGKYTERLITYIKAQSEAVSAVGTGEENEKLATLRKQMKIEHITADIPSLIAESLEGAERVKKIVQDMKSFSRADGAQCTMANLVDCIESTINIVWNELKYKATLKKEYGELPPIMCHPQQLNQVFLNLLVNAAHAIENQGEIKVRTWQENDSAHIAVSDTGCGIPEEIRSRIFEPFFTTKEPGKGTGLGLSISYDIVKKHGGDMTVESTVGTGTTFTVRLPLDAPPSRA